MRGCVDVQAAARCCSFCLEHPDGILVVHEAVPDQARCPVPFWKRVPQIGIVVRPLRSGDVLAYGKDDRPRGPVAGPFAILVDDRAVLA